MQITKTEFNRNMLFVKFNKQAEMVFNFAFIRGK
jgi:hypothetical protein